MKIYSVVLALVASLVVGCGGGPECPGCVVSYELKVELANGSPHERICDFQYSFRSLDGSLINGPQVPLRSVAAGGSISATDNVPTGQTVAVTAACWHPAYPNDSPFHAAASMRTGPLSGHVTCSADYSESGGVASMSLVCQ